MIQIQLQFFLQINSSVRCQKVWTSDFSCLPMYRGLFHLVAIIGWFTRKALALRISNTLEADFCVEVMNEAPQKLGTPDIMIMNQGSQFAQFAWTDR